MKSRKWNDNFRLINLIFAGIILAIIGYSILYGGGKAHPLPSLSELITGEESPSSGLSRSFSSIVRFQFNEARDFNPHGIRIFIFFLVQLLMRITGFLLANHPQRKMIVWIDSTISVILFVVCFWPFLENLSSYFTS